MDEENAEALRLREAIEEKMHAQDYSAARTLISEALRNLPRFYQANEMLMVCNILCSAKLEPLGIRNDWYWILQLPSAAKPADIEAGYQNIVSQLKPIMKDFPGTGLALKLATDAFSVLSDPEKRAAFDSKRTGFQNMLESSTLPYSSRPKGAAKRDCTEMQLNGDKPKKLCASSASWIDDQVNSTHACDPQESLGVPDENTLCSLSAIAQKRPVKDFYDFGGIRKLDSFSEGQIWAAYDEERMPRRYCKIDKIIPQKLHFWVTLFKPSPQDLRGKKWDDAGFPFACGTFVLETKKIALHEPPMFSHMISNNITRDSFEVYPKKGEVWAVYRDWNIEWCSDPDMRTKCGFEMIEILTDYLKDFGTKIVYLERVEGFKNVFQRYSKRGNALSSRIPADKVLMFSHKVPAFIFMGGELEGITRVMFELDPSAVPHNWVRDLSCAIVALTDTCSGSDVEKNSGEASTDFANPIISTTDTGGSSSGTQSQKPKLTPGDFKVDEVWAVYDDLDSMPRNYVKVIYVVSPTTVCVAFLEPQTTLDNEIQWVEENLPKVCGIFRACNSTANLDVSRFSHPVDCDRSPKKLFYRIFPKKGEVWAMYKNWSSKWKNSDMKGYQCQMVEILSDFSEESGVSMCCLVELEGYLTFFKRLKHNGFELFKQVLRSELLSFSHRIPAFKVFDIKNQEIPEGSLHLEPDALPPNKYHFAG